MSIVKDRCRSAVRSSDVTAEGAQPKGAERAYCELRSAANDRGGEAPACRRLGGGGGSWTRVREQWQPGSYMLSSRFNSRPRSAWRAGNNRGPASEFSWPAARRSPVLSSHHDARSAGV